MKKALVTGATALAAVGLVFTLAAPAPVLAADVGVSVSISQPGVYGRVDIGRFPQPALVVQQPVLVRRPVAVMRPDPVYMWVPPGHRQNWRRYCGQYNACGVPVYFVQDRWYDNHVRHHDRRDWRDDRRDGRRDDRRDGRHDDRHERGPGRH